MKPVIEEEKKESFFNKKKIFVIGIGIFIIGIMVLSVLDLSINNSQQTEKVTYKGINFVKTNNGWLGYKDDKPVYLVYSPLETANITMNINNIELLSLTSKNYLSSLPEDGLNEAISSFINRARLQRTPVSACYEDIKSCADLPIKTCEDADISTGVIIFKYSNETKVTLAGTCLTFEGENSDLIKYTDKLILNIDGV